MSNWTLQFEDNFKAGLDRSRWHITMGEWHAADGWLYGGENVDPLEDDTHGAIISLLLRVNGDQRVVFDAVGGPRLGDLSCLIQSHPQKSTLAGYLFGFGNCLNKESALAQHQRRFVVHDKLIEEGKLYHIVCERVGNHLRHIINDEVVAEYTDNNPPDKLGHAYENDFICFYIHCMGKITNVKVYNDGTPCEWSGPPKEPPLQPLIPMKDLVPDPLFEELQGDELAADHFFGYTNKCPHYITHSSNKLCRTAAKRFGIRFVLEEQYAEAKKYGIVYHGGERGVELEERGIQTRVHFYDPPYSPDGFKLPNGEVIPPVFPLTTDKPNKIWRLDPRWIDFTVRSAEYRARSGRYSYMLHDDELFHWIGQAVPRERWYKQMHEADKEIREKYGFGKYGLPEPNDIPEELPLKFLAYRRWISDKLADMFKRIHDVVKAIDPKIKIVGPTDGGSASGGDMNKWAKYFDIYGNPTTSGFSSAYLHHVRIGLLTKAFVDICPETDIWTMIHGARMMSGQRGPEDIREQYSQVYRNGGKGLWAMSMEFYENSLHDAMFAEPAQWKAMLACMEMAKGMRLPKQPKSDCAILWPSDSLLTSWDGTLIGAERRVENAYVAIGPLLRGALRFVSDHQLERGDRLRDCKVLYVPYAPYLSESAFSAVKDFAYNGGTVVVTDPNSFTWDIDGRKRGIELSEFTGLVMGDRRGRIEPISLSDDAWSLLPGRHALPIANTHVLRSFHDGQPCVSWNPYGRGRVYMFTADPFVAPGEIQIEKPLYPGARPIDLETLVYPGSHIVDFMRSIHESNGCKTGHDIWRFKLPPFKEDLTKREIGLCLTNNYIFDCNDPLLEPNNVDTGGTVQLDDRKPVPINDMPFTSRLDAYNSRNRSQLAKHSSAFTASFGEPFTLLFDFEKAYKLDRLRLWYSGTMPELTIGKKTYPWQHAGEDVKDVTIPVSGKHRTLKLNFAARQASAPFELCEVEIWSSRGDK